MKFLLHDSQGEESIYLFDDRNFGSDASPKVLKRNTHDGGEFLINISAANVQPVTVLCTLWSEPRVIKKHFAAIISALLHIDKDHDLNSQTITDTLETQGFFVSYNASKLISQLNYQLDKKLVVRKGKKGRGYQLRGTLFKCNPEALSDFVAGIRPDLPELVPYPENWWLGEKFDEFYISSESRKMLFVGDAGDGKSYSIKQYLTFFQEARRTSPVAVCFIGEKYRSFGSILRSLLVQMIYSGRTANRDIAEILLLLSAYRVPMMGSFETLLEQMEDDCLAETTTVLFKLLELYGHRPLIIIDGLNYCDSDTRAKIVGFVSDVIAGTLCTKVIISTQTFPEIAGMGAPVLDLSADERHLENKKQFVARISDFDERRDELFRYIEERRSFEFLQSVLGGVRSGRIAKRDSLPENLDNVYLDLIRCDEGFAKAGKVAAILRKNGFVSLACDDVLGFELCEKERIVSDSEGIFELDSNNHLRFVAGSPGAFEFFVKQNAEDLFAQNALSAFSLRVIDGEEYHHFDIDDCFALRTFYLHNIRKNASYFALYRTKYVRFELYCVLALWDTYFRTFESETRKLDYWTSRTSDLVAQIFKDFARLPAASRAELNGEYIKCRLRLAYGMFYRGSVCEAIKTLEELRDSERKAYEEDWEVRFGIDESYIWWNRDYNPEAALAASNAFLDYARSLGFSVTDEGVSTIAYYRIAVLYRIAVHDKTESSFALAKKEAADLLKQLSESPTYCELSDDKLINKVRLELAQICSRMKDYGSAIEFARLDACDRQLKYGKDCFFSIHALLVLARILSYCYRDSEELDANLYFESESIFLEVRNRFNGSVKDAYAARGYSELCRIKYDREHDFESIARAESLLADAVDRYKDIGGEHSYNYQTVKSEYDAFLSKYGRVLK